MFIKIDCRENDLLSACQRRLENDTKNMFSDINIKTEQLSLGDIVICDENENILALIERKTLKDLAASITDGRYAEQGHRLTECDLPNHNIIYLIEGSFQSYAPRPGGIPRTTLVSCMASINHLKGFSLYKTNSVVESAEWLLCFAKKIIKKDHSSTNDILKQNYVVVAKKAKKNSITRENINQIMLAQVPGVSSLIAETVIKKYNSLFDLFKTLENEPDALNDLTTTTQTGKTRKISKTAISNIKQYLMPSVKNPE